MKSEKTKSVFETLNAINVNGHTESYPGSKGKVLTYLSWAWAWDITKQHYPNMTSTVYENAEGLNYHHDGKTAWVKTGITIEGQEHIEYLPVMNNNKSIQLSAITSWDINNSIQRSLTKALARHGLAFYLYAGQDLPEVEVEANNAAEIDRAEKDAKDQTLINQYVHSVKKALDSSNDTQNDIAIREVFSEIADGGDRLKMPVYRLLLPEEQSVVTEIMLKTTKKEAA
jgi:hypothetical protein|tara:strand:- start:759 stop:1442 length:684 start_codon:yes stop_codon:yes gene_type:complete